LLADDHAMFRRGIASLLRSQPDVLVVGEAADGEEAVALARSTQPDVILMDVAMPRLGGLEAIRLIKQEMPAIQIIVLTISDNDQDLVTAIKHGAQGYLLKSMEPSQLFDTLNATRRGEVLLPRAALDRIREGFRDPERKAAKPRGKAGDLTPRESEILRLVARGLTNKQIGDALCITESTVKLHLHNILEKLHLSNRIQLAIYAVQQGLGGRAPEPE
jgi:DNA-binding NarL/FixJ family response regulator